MNEWMNEWKVYYFDSSTCHPFWDYSIHGSYTSKKTLQYGFSEIQLVIFFSFVTKKAFFQNVETGSKKNSASQSDLPKSKSDVAVQNGGGNEPSNEDAEDEDEEEATMPVEIEWGETVEEREGSRRLKTEVVNDHGKTLTSRIQIASEFRPYSERC